MGAGTADAWLALLDAQILRDVAKTYPPGHRVSKDEIIAGIPTKVREYLRLGQLSVRGATVQESVERHSKRLRAKLDRIDLRIGSLAGSCIIQKSK